MNRKWGRLLVWGLIGALMILMVPGAMAGSGTGSLATGSPQAFIFTTTEAEFLIKACSGIPASQGVDAYIIDMQGHTYLSVTSSSPASSLVDLNVNFYGADCGYRPGPSEQMMGTSFTRHAQGAKWAAVSSQGGASITLNWTTHS